MNAPRTDVDELASVNAKLERLRAALATMPRYRVGSHWHETQLGQWRAALAERDRLRAVPPEVIP
jgi:hypothetical protein